MTTINATTMTFDDNVMKAERPVIVDFWASWCGPCKAVAPILEKISDERAGVVDVVKVDIDANPELAARYGITSIPTLMLFKNGENVSTLMGARPKPAIDAEIDRVF